MRPKPKPTEMILGEHAVEAVLKAGCRTIFSVALRAGLQKGPHAEAAQTLKALARKAQIEVREVSDRTLPADAWVGASVGPFQYSDFTQFAAQSHPFLCMLDRIQDPQNLGAMLRSMYALGCSGAILPRHQAVGITPVVSGVSAGAAELLPVARVTNLSQTLDKLKDSGFFTVAAMPQGTSLFEVSLPSPLVLVVGNEGQGVGPHLAKACDLQVAIPMARPFDSLNASVSLGILAYEIRRQQSCQ